MRAGVWRCDAAGRGCVMGTHTQHSSLGRQEVVRWLQASTQAGVQLLLQQQIAEQRCMWRSSQGCWCEPQRARV